MRIEDQPLADVVPCLGADLEPRPQRRLVWQIVSGLLEGDEGEEVELELADAQGGRHTMTLARVKSPAATSVKFGNLPEVIVEFDRSFVEPAELGGDEHRIGVIRFNYWMMPVAQWFEEAVVEMKDATGVIIDLRGNPGGVAGLSPGLAGYFVGEAESLGTLEYRQDELFLRINPRRVSRKGEKLETYTGPLAILVDELSASTSEIFSAGLQDLGRARIFGETSMAAALPAVIEALPNGDLLMHALADLKRPSGERIEGIGVIPDEAVPLTREGLLEGRDEPLEAAIRWIVGEAEGSASEER